MRKIKISILASVFALLVFPGIVKAQTVSSGPVQPFSFQGTGGSTSGTVTLTWSDPKGLANDYDLMYGTQPGVNLYGARAIMETPGTNTFTVNYLVPGQTYYFTLVGEVNFSFSALSGPIAVTATPGVAQTLPSSNVVSAVPAPAGATASVYIANGAPSVLSSDPTPFNFNATTGVGNGTVSLSWADKYGVANRFAIMYGLTPGNYSWGAWGIPESSSMAAMNFTVGGLTSGQTYYFALVSEQNGQVIAISSPRVAVAK